jgi:hypothetical protein
MDSHEFAPRLSIRPSTMPVLPTVLPNRDNLAELATGPLKLAALLVRELQALVESLFAGAEDA